MFIDIFLELFSAALHPWNMMMEKDEQHISFLVFVYGLALSLILIKLLSWWNFMVYLAICFLIYSFGGAQMVMKWLGWYLFNLTVCCTPHTEIFFIIKPVSNLRTMLFCELQKFISPFYPESGDNISFNL